MKVSGVEVPYCFWLLFTQGFQIKWETLVKKLEQHSNKGEKCQSCQQLQACVGKFDERVERDVCCPSCHRWNTRSNNCDRCGHELRLKKVDREELELAAKAQLQLL